MANRRMEVVKRDDTDFKLTFKDVDGNPIDLTNCIVFFTVKNHADDEDDDAVISTEIEDFEQPEQGIAILQITKEQADITPKSYFFDIQLKDQAGKITSTYAGRFIVNQDVTIRTAIDNDLS